MGVRELRTPASALSIPCSAIQNKYAGIRLPNVPDKKMNIILFRGICLKVFIATGNNTIPEEIIRKEATWNGFNLTKPSFIKMKLLPQIKESATKSSQLYNLLFKRY